jgi:hypothetical protein
MKKSLTETHPSTEQGNVSRKNHPNIGPHKDLNKDLMVDENPLTETHPSTKGPFNEDLLWKKTLNKDPPIH